MLVPGIRYVLSGEVTFTEGGEATIRTAWLAFLNTVRTQHFDQVLALRPLLPAIAKAA